MSVSKNYTCTNQFVGNRTVYMYKMDLALITYNGRCAIKPNQTKPKFDLSFDLPINSLLINTER